MFSRFIASFHSAPREGDRRRAVIVRKQGDQRFLAGVQGEPVHVFKGEIPEPESQRTNGDKRSTEFGAVIRQQMRQGWQPSLSGLRPKPATAKKAEPVSLQKGRGDRMASKRRDRAVMEATAETIDRVVAAAVAETLERVNAALGDLAEVRKAEPSYEEKVVSRRRELMEIDAQIAMGKSGMLEFLLDQPVTVSKEDRQEDVVRQAAGLGIQAHRRVEPYPGAR